MEQSIDFDFVIPKQLEPLLEDKERHQVWTAHRRFGKTTGGLSKILLDAFNTPNGEYFYIGPTYKQARMIAWEPLNKMIPPELVINRSESKLSIELYNHARVDLKGQDYPDSLRGVGLNGAFFDEYPLQDPSIFTKIIRPALADKGGWSVKAGTPIGKNHHYDDMQRTAFKHFYPASKTGVISQHELEAMKAEMSQDEYDQELECKFLYFAGQIYKEFRPEVHIIDPFELPKGWSYGIGLDYGLRNPTAIIFRAIDYDGNTYYYDEIYESGQQVKELADKVKIILPKPIGAADPSIAAKNHVKNGIPYSIHQEFIDNGISLALAPNQVIAGINLVKQQFSKNKIFIFRDRCPNLVRELESYRWKEKNTRTQHLPEMPVKVNDHAVDALRYDIASRFNAPLENKNKYEGYTNMEIRVKKRFEKIDSPKRKSWDPD